MENLKVTGKEKVVRSDSGGKEEDRTSNPQSPANSQKATPHLSTKPPLSPPPSQLSPRLQPKHSKVCTDKEFVCSFINYDFL